MTAKFRKALEVHYRVMNDLQRSREAIRQALTEWSREESQKAAADELGKSRAYINDVIHGHREWGANRGKTKGL